ncbi:MAG TPA: hypothetical protein VFW42_05105 [Fluviicoccus sp.]|nr:hypothetical protein [Fluviicoccus sp.]
MKCREYIFQLTSGQLRDAPKALRLEAAMHRMMCRYCRTFTRNDAALDRILAGYRESLQKPEDARENS